MTGRSQLGRRGETLAADYLQQRGWVVIERNLRYREGEIDLVVARDGVLAFVEVKTRRTRTFGAPVEAVTRTKAQRIRRVAARYLIETCPKADVIRFDVMDLASEGEGFAITHLEGVF
ncbi:MAG TPA: YraN family protein [Actinomycetota bacterium]